MKQPLIDFLIEEYTELLIAISKDNPLAGTPMEGLAYENAINNMTAQFLKTKWMLALRYGCSRSEVKQAIEKVEIAVRQKMFE